ncbi:MAG: glutamate-5-semialdehyde dehydrogenase [Clostridiales bacterium]|nr:glutamate-5-semialdehyde dehydrogenase [Clostridiales bacterium]
MADYEKHLKNLENVQGSSYIEKLCKKAVLAKNSVSDLKTSHKNMALERLAQLLIENTEEIIKQNQLDLKNAESNGMAVSMMDRLRLDSKRIEAMAEGVRQIIALKDPVGEIIGGGPLINGLNVIKQRVPLGVIGIIFESRPNVTVDAAALCIKSGNVSILRGGSDAIHSNICLAEIIRRALDECSIPKDMVLLVEDTSRKTATQLMQMNGYIDVLIPRGGKGLINAVVKNSTVPVIETGAGNCHAFVDESADIDEAISIVDNAKTQRPSVCNAIETLLVHKNIAEQFLPKLKGFWGNKVEIRGDKESSNIIKIDFLANDDDYYTEYNDFVISLKIVDDVEEAISHINKHGTRHSELIITKNMKNASVFQNKVDAAAVYVNASTRFTDGYEMGLGAEIGISTQKLHARGPMGLNELTSYKYLINGDGQIRE